jgi:hypothetical protein
MKYGWVKEVDAERGIGWIETAADGMVPFIVNPEAVGQLKVGDFVSFNTSVRATGIQVEPQAAQV